MVRNFNNIAFYCEVPLVAVEKDGVYEALREVRLQVNGYDGEHWRIELVCRKDKSMGEKPDYLKLSWGIASMTHCQLTMEMVSTPGGEQEQATFTIEGQPEDPRASQLAETISRGLFARGPEVDVFDKLARSTSCRMLLTRRANKGLGHPRLTDMAGYVNFTTFLKERDWTSLGMEETITVEERLSILDAMLNEHWELPKAPEASQAASLPRRIATFSSAAELKRVWKTTLLAEDRAVAIAAWEKTVHGQAEKLDFVKPVLAEMGPEGYGRAKLTIKAQSFVILDERAWVRVSWKGQKEFEARGIVLGKPSGNDLVILLVRKNEGDPTPPFKARVTVNELFLHKAKKRLEVIDDLVNQAVADKKSRETAPQDTPLALYELLYGIMQLDHKMAVPRHFEDSEVPQNIVDLFDHANVAQKDAVLACVHDSGDVTRGGVTLIHGPAGTGKTETLEMLAAAIKRLSKGPIQVCTPSNAAAETIRNRLQKYNELLLAQDPQSVRIRVVFVASQSRDSILMPRHEGRHPLDFCAVIEAKAHDLHSYGSPEERKTFGRWKGIMRSAKDTSKKILSKEEKDFFKKHLAELVARVTSETDVFISTLANVCDARLQVHNVKYLIVDEAAHALEPDILAALHARTPRQLVLLGDPKQLEPYSQAAAPQLLMSMMERLMMSGHTMAHFLYIQYRQHPSISRIVNVLRYDGRMKNGNNLLDRPSCALAEALLWELTGNAECVHRRALWVNVDSHERLLAGGTFSNIGSAEVSVRLFLGAVNFGYRPGDVAIITPYRGQVSMILELLAEALPPQEYQDFVKADAVRTVDSIIGKDWQVVICDLVRSNNRQGPLRYGFLSRDSRPTVALTRAQEVLFIVGDCGFLAGTKAGEEDAGYPVIFSEGSSDIVTSFARAFYEDRMEIGDFHLPAPGDQDAGSRPAQRREPQREPAAEEADASMGNA